MVALIDQCALFVDMAVEPDGQWTVSAAGLFIMCVLISYISRSSSHCRVDGELLFSCSTVSDESQDVVRLLRSMRWTNAHNRCRRLARWQGVLLFCKVQPPAQRWLGGLRIRSLRSEGRERRARYGKVEGGLEDEEDVSMGVCPAGVDWAPLEEWCGVVSGV